VDITSALVSDLAILTEALHDPATDHESDLETTLSQLADDVTFAVRSYLGMSITIRADGYPITLTATTPAASHTAVRSSLLIPLPLLSSTEAGSTLTLYAGRLGAFVDMAADLSWTLGLSLSTFVLDKHRNVDLTAPNESGLAELSLINQATGALIDQGVLPESVQTLLAQRAADADTTVVTIARQILTSLTGGPDQPG
jgi:hypothetical protein